jgi:hypothetical protein
MFSALVYCSMHWSNVLCFIYSSGGTAHFRASQVQKLRHILPMSMSRKMTRTYYTSSWYCGATYHYIPVFHLCARVAVVEDCIAVMLAKRVGTPTGGHSVLKSDVSGPM